MADPTTSQIGETYHVSLRKPLDLKAKRIMLQRDLRSVQDVLRTLLEEAPDPRDQP